MTLRPSLHLQLAWCIGERLLLMQANYTINDWLLQEND